MLAIACALALFTAPKEAIPVVVDARIELVTTVFRLADAEEFKMSGCDSAYSRSVDKYFAPFKHHRAVELARQLRDKDEIGFDAVPSLAVNLTDIDMLAERIPFDLPPARWDRRWPIKDARAFVTELKKFVKDTRYKQFLESEKPFFALATHGMTDLLRSHDVSSWIQGFYGSRPSRNPFVIVGLLCGGGNYGMSVQFPDGSLEMSPVFGAWRYAADGSPVYDESDLSTVLHEFSHGYINSLVRPSVASLTSAAKALSSRNRSVLAANAYGSEETILYETFVRAVETFLVKHHLSAALAEESVIEQRSHGFLWTSDLVDRLEEYSKNRTKYPAFKDFLPILEQEFARLAKDPEAIYSRCPKVIEVKPLWGEQDEMTRRVSVRVTFDRPMRIDSRGVSLKPEGWEVVKKTQFASDARSLEIGLKLKKGVRYEFALNRNGRGLLSETGYPVLPYKTSLNSMP